MAARSGNDGVSWDRKIELSVQRSKAQSSGTLTGLRNLLEFGSVRLSALSANESSDCRGFIFFWDLLSCTHKGLQTLHL